MTMKSAINGQKRGVATILLSVILLAVLGLAQSAFSQVEIIGSWVTGTSHTKEAGTNRALIFIAHCEDDDSPDIVLNTVSFGGQSMTPVTEILVSSGDPLTRACVAAFILDEAGVGAASGSTFSVSWNQTPDNVVYTSVLLQDVNQTTLTGDEDNNGTTSGNTITTSALTTNDGDMVIIGATCGNSGSYTFNNGFTEGTDQSFSSSTGAAGHKSATGAAETPSVTHSGANRQVLIGFVVNGTPPNPNIATGPNPGNGEDNVLVSTNLSWDSPAGYIPTSYDVYFGTNPTAHSNPKHTVYTGSYDPPGDLDIDTTYYWAVDSNDDGTIYAGNDWHFTTYAPVMIGDLVAEYIISQSLGTYYATVCAYYGVMIYSEITEDTGLKDSVIAAYPSSYYSGSQMPPEGSVDDNVYGILPFELYRQTGDANYLTAALYLADAEFENPRPDGLSEYTRFWIDDTYMIGSLQVQAYKSMGDINYANHAVTQLLGYMGEVENLQQSNGLFYHTLSAPIHWGRGNGWAASAMTEVLLGIPEDHPQRAELMTKYQNMMAGLVTYQDASGMWYQVLDMGSDPRNWVESSCTGMFVFALTTGVDQGWLPEEPYKQAALDGWAALEDYVDEQGRVHEVCIGTGASSDVQYYFDRPTEIGNHHGQAAVIWAATAIERMNSTADIKGDIDGDEDVDFDDLDILAENWLGDEPSADIFPSGGDGIIDFLDFAEFAQDWLK